MRLLLAALCIASTLLLEAWYEHLLQIVFLIVVIFVLAADKQAALRLCWRNWQLLRWILIPTVVLHAIFTPGALIFPQFFIPISQEGLQLGGSLALHWAAIFTLAMLLGRLFPIERWIEGVSHYPRLHHILYPYLCLFPRMNLLVRALIRRHYRYWNDLPWTHPIQKISQLPPHLLSLLLQMKQHSQRCAKHVWEHWGQAYQPLLIKPDMIQQQYLPHSMVIMLAWIAIDIGVFH
ncbi:MAG: hypothetical protein COA61_001005 [Zetaproteobacteria bacterium]|nr:hypothetical protein [Zetaproteobacteria bacterium]